MVGYHYHISSIDSKVRVKNNLNMSEGLVPFVICLRIIYEAVLDDFYQKRTNKVLWKPFLLQVPMY